MTSFPLASVISVTLCFIKKSSPGSGLGHVLVGNTERTNARTSIPRTKSKISLQLPTRTKRSAPSMSLSSNDSTKRACRKMGGEKFQNVAFAYYLSPPIFRPQALFSIPTILLFGNAESRRAQRQNTHRLGRSAPEQVLCPLEVPQQRCIARWEPAILEPWLQASCKFP